MYNLIPTRRSMDNLYNFFDAFDHDSFGDMMRTDITDEGDSLVLRAELPGFDKSEIEMEVQNGILTVSASHKQETEDSPEGAKEPRGRKYLVRERRYSAMKRSYQLEGVDEDAITADFENGVLKLTMPKEKTQVSRKIALQ